MTTANAATIMRRAWEIKRQHADNVFGECLRMAWAEARRGVVGDPLEVFRAVGRDTYSFRAELKAAGFTWFDGARGVANAPASVVRCWIGSQAAIDKFVAEAAARGTYRPKIRFESITVPTNIAA